MRGPLHKLESKIGKLAGKAAKLRGFAFPSVIKKVTEATLAQQRASRRSGIISSTRTREM